MMMAMATIHVTTMELVTGGDLAAKLEAGPLACAEAARLLSNAELGACTLYTSTEPCAMCAGAIYWVGIGRVVFALAETGLLRYTGDDPENPTLDLPCREVFARGQRKVMVEGPFLEEEAGAVHEGFWGG